MKNKWIILLLSLALPLGVGFLSGYLTRGETSGPWYAALQKPSFQPPGWVFGPVWTTLYALMGVSLYMIYTAPASRARTWALAIFALQLTLNFFWSLIFFRWHQLGLASAEILLLLAAILAMATLFYKVRPLAGYLQVPYIAWVSFATLLTCTIYWLNR